MCLNQHLDTFVSYAPVGAHAFSDCAIMLADAAERTAAVAAVAVTFFCVESCTAPKVASPPPKSIFRTAPFPRPDEPWIACRAAIAEDELRASAAGDARCRRLDMVTLSPLFRIRRSCCTRGPNESLLSDLLSRRCSPMPCRRVQHASDRSVRSDLRSFFSMPFLLVVPGG